MGFEYFSTLEEALKVFTEEQRAIDFVEFVIAMSFCKTFDLTKFEGTDESIKAIETFQAFLKPIKASSLDDETHTLIREKATTLAMLLQENSKERTIKDFFHKDVRIRSTPWTEQQGISNKMGFVVEIYDGRLQVQFIGINGIFELDMEDVELHRT